MTLSKHFLSHCFPICKMGMMLPSAQGHLHLAGVLSYAFYSITTDSHSQSFFSGGLEPSGFSLLPPLERSAAPLQRALNPDQFFMCSG